MNRASASATPLAGARGAVREAVRLHASLVGGRCGHLLDCLCDSKAGVGVLGESRRIHRDEL
jgi:hypothetical protein